MEVVARAGLVAARVACALLSPLSIDALRRLGGIAGDLAIRRNGRGVRTTRINIDLAYAEHNAEWRERTTRESVRQTAMIASEAVALWTWPLSRLAALSQHVEGEELLRRRPPSRGALILAPHFGNWEYLGYHLNTIEPLAPLYERPNSKVVDQALRAARARLGHRSASDTVGGLRQLVRVLRCGGMAAVLPDQVPRVGAGVTAPFFGRGAYTMSLVSKLLARVDAEVLIGTAARVPGGFDVRIETVDAAIRSADPVVSATAMNAAVEAVIARHPTQYQWEYKRYRFRRQPNVYR